MSTRGLYGFRYLGSDKLAYNHSDSYPDDLGHRFLEFLADISVSDLKDFYGRIELVDEDAHPSKAAQKYCEENGYGSASQMQKGDEWYWLLRNVQGNFKKMSEIAKSGKRLYMIDDRSFIKNSLFCEYAYIANLDDGVLEFYRGFQKRPCKSNRYGCVRDEDGYYPCKCVLKIPFGEIKKGNIDEFVKKMQDASA